MQVVSSLPSPPCDTDGEHHRRATDSLSRIRFLLKTEEMNEQIEPNQTNSHTIASTAAGQCWVSWLCLGFTHQYELISSELVWYEDQLKVGCVGDSDLVLNTLEFVDQETMVSECDLNCRGLLLVVQCFMLMHDSCWRTGIPLELCALVEHACLEG